MLAAVVIVVLVVGLVVSGLTPQRAPGRQREPTAASVHSNGSPLSAGEGSNVVIEPSPTREPPAPAPAVSIEPSRAVVDVDVVELLVRGGLGAGDDDLLGVVKTLGVAWPALSPVDRTRAAQALADAIMARRDMPPRLRAVLSAMSHTMRSDVLAVLVLHSDESPLPAALLVSP